MPSFPGFRGGPCYAQCNGLALHAAGQCLDSLVAYDSKLTETDLKLAEMHRILEQKIEKLTLQDDKLLSANKELVEEVMALRNSLKSKLAVLDERSRQSSPTDVRSPPTLHRTQSAQACCQCQTETGNHKTGRCEPQPANHIGE